MYYLVRYEAQVNDKKIEDEVMVEAHSASQVRESLPEVVQEKYGQEAVLLGAEIAPDEDYTTTEAAQLLGVLPQTVSRHIKRGLLHAEKRGRDYFITSEDLERFKAARRKPGKPPNPEAKYHGWRQKRISGSF